MPPPASSARGSQPPASLSYPSRRSHQAAFVHTFTELLGFLDRNAERTRRTPGFAVFYQDLSALERERCERLWAAIRLLELGQSEEAAREAEVVTRWMPDEEDGHGATLVRTFAEAILGRAHKLSGSGGNLYLGARPPGAQLRAFELLRLRTPLIPFGYAAANRALLDALDGPSDVTLLDVGIGRGGQIRALLKNPWARRLIRSLHVIGVEPDASADTGGALEVAEANVLGAADEAHVPTTFAGIPKLAEALTVADLRAADPRGVLLANASLALHHVGLPEHGARLGRAGVLATLHDAGYERVVLLEPDSNHFDDDLALRFLHAYRHYGTLSRSLQATLAPADAVLVWTEFFAQEVRNVITHDGPLRVERHEEHEVWLERLEEGGWVVDTPAELVAPSAAPAGFQVLFTGRACTLRYGGVSLLGVMRARRA